VTVGLKSVLFGAHAFWLHPIAVWLAWIKLYRRLPNRLECLAILFHDIGYAVNCKTMDGPDGLEHPVVGARIAKRVARFFGARTPEASYVETLILGHSRSFCAEHHIKLSELNAPDKYAILYDPAWFYWIRTTLSGEIHEYRRNEEEKQGQRISSTWRWLCAYRQSVKARFSKQ